MKKMPWLKLHTEIRTDPKMLALNDMEFRIWIYALCLAADSKVRGVICIDEGIPYPADALSRAMFIDTKTLQDTITKFCKLKMVEVREDETIILLHFNERQYEYPSDRPEAARERKKNQREREKNVQENESHDNVTSMSREKNEYVTNMSRESHGLDTDTETDKEKDLKHIAGKNISGGEEQKKSQKSNPAVKRMIDHYHALFVEKFGEKPAINGKKDGSLLQKLLDTYGEEKLKGLLNAFFVSHDPFIQASGYTIGVFKSQVNKLLTGQQREKSDGFEVGDAKKKQLIRDLYMS